MDNRYALFFQLGLILLISNLIRALFIRIKIPYVIGLLLFGVLLGPTILGYIHISLPIEWIAQIGVLLLIFEAGISTNIKKIAAESRRATLPALGGIVFPFIFGFLLSSLFHYDTVASLFIGVIFTATSISISVITLMDVGKLKSIEGRCIVNSAIIDDVLGIILVSFILGLSVKQTGITTHFYQNELFLAIVGIIAFFAIAILFGILLIPRLYRNSGRLLIENSLLSISVALIFIYSWFAEHSGLAAITGAYLAGLFIGQTEFRTIIENEISQLGKSFFVDVFFVSIGLGLNLKGLTIKPLYLIFFVLLSFISKVLGSTLGARLSQFDFTRSLRIGIGMMPRGEVALIIAAMGLKRGVISSDIFSATVIMVIATSLLTPFLIKMSYSALKKTSFDK